MRFSRTALFAAAAAAAAVGAVVVGVLPANAAGTNYVALGDSYSAGDGAGNYTNISCLRSANAYPQLWANNHKPASFSFVACSGAKTSDVINNQVSALSGSTTLVTITIGGNDVDFAGVMTTCATGTDQQCQDAINNDGSSSLPGKLDNTYAAITSHAPNAKVVVLGYPHIFVSGPAFCPMDQNKRTMLNSAADQLDSLISQRASAAGFTFADARPKFDGHGVCSSTPWIHGAVLTDLVESYHPNQTGQSSGYYPTLTGVTG